MIPRRANRQLKHLLAKFPAVVLIGPRQVGKTTLAREFLSQDTGIYLDLESPRDQRKISRPEEYLGKHVGELVILDEIQHLPKLFAPLRGLIDEGRRVGRPHGQYLLLGSGSLEVIQQSSETLAGRIAYLELFPLDLLEVGETHQDRLWLRGGFPNSFLSKSDEDSSEQRDFLIRSYLEREIPRFGGRTSPAELRRLWTMLAHSQGGVVNTAALSRNLDLDVRTVKSYLTLLEDLLLVRLLEPWFKNTGKRLIKSPKAYIRDSGIVHELLGITGLEYLLGHPVVGGSWEGFVIENLLAVAPPRTEAYFYRTSAGAEIDLVLKFRDQTVWTIEIKRGLSPNLSKGFYHALDDLSPDKAFVVYGGDDQFNIGKGIEMISLASLQKELLQHPSNRQTETT